MKPQAKFLKNISLEYYLIIIDVKNQLKQIHFDTNKG